MSRTSSQNIYKPLSSGPQGYGSHDNHMGSPTVLQEPDAATTTSYSAQRPMLTTSKSFGNLARQGRGKKSRAFKWLVLYSNGDRQLLTLDKRQIIQVCKLDIPIRDLRLMDAALGAQQATSQLLVRDNALVFSMEHVRLLIMHDKVVTPLDDDKSELKERFLSFLELTVNEWALRAGQGPGMGPGSPTRPGASAFGMHSGQAPTHAALGLTGSGGGGGGGSLQSQVSIDHQQQQQRGSAHGYMGTGGGGGAGGSSHHPGMGMGMGTADHSGGGARYLGMGMGMGSDAASASAYDASEHQPFEMHVLEAALSEVCQHVAREVGVLQQQSQPALEALTKTADTSNLEAVRRIKTQHQRLTARITDIREALQRLMEDDADVQRMCLTTQEQLKQAATAAQAAAAQAQATQMAALQAQQSAAIAAALEADSSLPTMLLGSSLTSSFTPLRPGHVTRAMRQQQHHGNNLGLLGMNLGRQPRTPSLGESLSDAGSNAANNTSGNGRSSSGNAAGAGSAAGDGGGTAAGATAGGGGGGAGAVCMHGIPGLADDAVTEHDFLDVEALLESYFIQVDAAESQLQSIGEYIDDTEDLINIQLDYSRNKLIRFDILLTTGTFSIAFFNIVTGILGENLVLPEAITQDLWGFVLVNFGTLLFCFATFSILVFLFKLNKVL